MEETAIGVKGLLFRDGKVLVLIKSDGEPDLPGGRIEAGESLEDGLHREIKEETGLNVLILRPNSEWSFVKGPAQRVIGMTFDCRYLSGNLKLSPEHSGHRWANPSELGNINFKRPFLGGKGDDYSNRA